MCVCDLCLAASTCACARVCDPCGEHLYDTRVCVVFVVGERLYDTRVCDPCAWRASV